VKIFDAGVRFDSAPTLKLLIYGRSGTGKTTWASKAPDPLVILIESQGWQSVGAAQRNTESTVDRCTVIVETWAEFTAVWKAVLTAQIDSSGYATARIAGSDRRFRSVVLDGITRLSAMLQRRMVKTTGDVAWNPDERPTMTTPQWGRVIDIVSNVLDDVGKMPVSVIVTGLAEDYVEGEGDNALRRSKLHIRPRGLAAAAGQFFNAVGFATVFKGHHVIVWASDARYDTKPFRGFPKLTSADVTLGSLLLAQAGDGATVPFNQGDSAEQVRTFELTEEK
jgi:hypothetical protein